MKSLLLVLAALFLCFPAYSQTNAMVNCNILYCTNGTDWISTNIYTEAVTNLGTGFYRSLSEIVPLTSNRTDISSVVYYGTNLTNVNIMVYVGYFIVNSTNVNVQSVMSIECGNGSGGGSSGTNECNVWYEEIIWNNNPMVPPETIIHCLDGIYVFDFLAG